MRKKQYHTAGRESLLAFLRSHPDKQFSAEELYREVNATATAGKSSVYRHLSALCAEDTVRSFRSEEGACNLYQYVGNGCDCRDHFHEKCVVCGKLEHLDCHITEEFIRHLQKEHGFAVNCGQSILYGVCATCREREEGASHA